MHRFGKVLKQREGKMQHKKSPGPRRSNRNPSSNRIRKRATFAPTDALDAIESVLSRKAAEPDREELSELDARLIALRNHPDLEGLDRRGVMPNELCDQNGNIWNPGLHIDLHMVIERQLDSDQPEGIVAIAIEMEREGKLCAHDVKHVLMSALTWQIFQMQKEDRVFDEQEYFRDIQEDYATWDKSSS